LVELRSKLIKALSLIEFELDVSEDELDEERLNTAFSLLVSVREIFSTLLKTYHDGRIITSGARVVLSGEPNVGKSTLLNALLGKNRAITSDAPGTTRDTIEAYSVVGGVPVCFVDTAGIRETNNAIESDGVRRSIEEIETSDFTLRIIDNISYPVDIINVKTLVVLNKSDLFSQKQLKLFLNKHNNVVSISAIREQNISLLENKILSGLLNDKFHSADIYLTTSRQNSVIKDCHGGLENILSSWNVLLATADVLAFEIRDVIDNLGFLMGPTTPDTVLDKVFNSFCVGK
jgi:tRNA modification GTPase